MAEDSAERFNPFTRVAVPSDSTNPDERPQPTPAEKILVASREPRDPAVVAGWFDEIALLALESDAAGLAAKVAELAGPQTSAPLTASLQRPIEPAV